MSDIGQQANPLSEIALAMAMAFFSIMVLALISMGGIVVDEPRPAIPESALHKIVPSETKNIEGHAERTNEPELIIFYNGSFLNSSLETVAPKAWKPEGQPVLALAPTATLLDTVSAKSKLPFPNVTITTLDERWLRRLKELTK